MFRFFGAQRFKALAVWGGGTMGGGIAQVAAQAKVPVTIVEVDDKRISASRSAIEANMSRIAKKQFPDDSNKQKEAVDEVLSRITFSTDADAVAAKADCIIEAVVEDINVKKELWKKLDKLAQKDCVFATNTSSLSVAEQASVTERAERFAGLHFFSPVPLMKLVEVVKAEKTSQQTVDQLLKFVESVSKTPVVTQDTKGFIVNRLLIPYILEACRLVERGVATVEDVDVAMKLGAGHPMGPFTLCDSIGIDVVKLVMDAWHKEEPDNQLFTPCKLLNDKVAEGKLGRKTGEGFYNYKNKK